MIATIITFAKPVSACEHTDRAWSYTLYVGDGKPTHEEFLQSLVFPRLQFHVVVVRQLLICDTPGIRTVMRKQEDDHRRL